MSAAEAPQRRTDAGSGATPPPAWKRTAKRVVATLAVLTLVSLPWSGPPLLARLDYFHLRQFVFEGIRYARPRDLVHAARVDTTRSIWQDITPITRAIEAHPLVASASIRRRLPGTLVVRIEEREPVAQVQGRGLLRFADGEGRELPIDPARTPIDVPIVATADSVVLRLLDAMRREAPELYARVSSARRVGGDHLLFDLDDFLVRTRDNVTVGRFRDILPVEADLARNNLRAIELDLRFQDQVIVRQP